jgi:hypothetical protein
MQLITKFVTVYWLIESLEIVKKAEAHLDVCKEFIDMFSCLFPGYSCVCVSVTL